MALFTYFTGSSNRKTPLNKKKERKEGGGHDPWIVPKSLGGPDGGYSYGNASRREIIQRSCIILSLLFSAFSFSSSKEREKRKCVCVCLRV